MEEFNDVTNLIIVSRGTTNKGTQIHGDEEVAMKLTGSPFLSLSHILGVFLPETLEESCSSKHLT